MRWSEDEINQLSPILEQIHRDLMPLQGKRICVLCSGPGDVALWLGARVGSKGRVIGLDMSQEMLEAASRRAEQEGLERVIEFARVDKIRSRCRTPNTMHSRANSSSSLRKRSRRSASLRWHGW